MTAIIVALILFSLKKNGVTMNFSFFPRYKKRLTDGFIMTVEISVFSLLLSMLIGCVSAAFSQSKLIILRYFGAVYVKFIKGTPLLMQIYLFFYTVDTARGITNRILAGALILSIFEGAYISEIVRGSFLSIEASQKEAGLACGFSKTQIFRYIIVPRMLPGPFLI